MRGIHSDQKQSAIGAIGVVKKRGEKACTEGGGDPRSGWYRRILGNIRIANPGPHWSALFSGGWIQIRILIDAHNWDVEAQLRAIEGSRSRIRIRIRVTSLIRIRIKVERGKSPLVRGRKGMKTKGKSAHARYKLILFNFILSMRGTNVFFLTLGNKNFVLYYK